MDVDDLTAAVRPLASEHVGAARGAEDPREGKTTCVIYYGHGSPDDARPDDAHPPDARPKDERPQGSTA